MIVDPDRTRNVRRDVPSGVNRLFDLAIGGFEGTGETVTSRGVRVVASFKRIKTTNWILAANLPQSELYAPIHRAKWYLLAALMIIPFISLFIVSGFMRHLTAPLLRFTEHVKGIAVKGDSPEPVQIQARDEIGTLALAFNEMLAEMEKRKTAIREQKEFSENMLLDSAVPTFVLDTRHRVVIWNKACEELTGVKAAAILGTQNAWKGFYREQCSVLADIVIGGDNLELPSEGGPFNRSPFASDGLQAEGWRLTSDGRNRYLFFDAAPVRNAEGEIVAAIQTVQDLTEQKRMQDELFKAQKLESLGVLAGGIAHDFNNILTGILGNLSLANARLEAGHGIAGYLHDCEKAAVRASKLTQQLLTFARGGEPVKKLIDPASLITETVSFVLRGSSVRAVLDLVDDLWSVQADSGQLSQALHNVLLNAAQAMPDGGEVTVRAVNETLEAENTQQLPPGHYLRISIEDRGCGISPENLARIFDPYFTTKPDGSGLGLASVYSIIKRHGGAVGVSSRIGMGSCVTMHIPASPGGHPEGEESRNMPEPAGSGKVLIMDDEDMIREIASEILGFYGYEVEGCADGAEAVDRFRSARVSCAPFDAVILDLTVPGGMGGLKAAALMLEIDPDAVLIVSSGYSNDPVAADYRRYGFKGVVPKPFDSTGLVGEVGYLIKENADRVQSG